MTLLLDRCEIESAGSDPVKLAKALHSHLPGLDCPVPIEEIALSLDIVGIEAKPLASLEGCLQCDALKSTGQIIVNAASSTRRQCFTIAHELGHFLNERHQPTSEHGFECTASDMAYPRRSGVHLNQEREANTFAIEVLAPSHLLQRHLTPAPELDHALAIAERFDISREAAIRRYIELSEHCIAAVFAHDDQIRYIEKTEDLPRLIPWTGQPLPDLPANPDGDPLSPLGAVDVEAWVVAPNHHNLFVQTLTQQDGYSVTLLVAEPNQETDAI